MSKAYRKFGVDIEGDELVIWCHTIDSEMIPFLGKDESEQFIRFKKDQWSKVLKAYGVASEEELMNKLIKVDSIYPLKEKMELSKLLFEYDLI
jgi:hypothetical protein